MHDRTWARTDLLHPVGTVPTQGLQWNICLGVEQAPELTLVAQGWARTSYGLLGLRSLEPEHGLLGQRPHKANDRASASSQGPTELPPSPVSVTGTFPLHHQGCFHPR